MSFEWINESDPPVLQCTGDMGHIECGELREHLLTAAAEGRDLRIDISKVADAGTIFVQLLISARRTAELQGRSWVLQGASDSVQAAFARVAVAEGR